MFHPSKQYIGVSGSPQDSGFDKVALTELTDEANESSHPTKACLKPAVASSWLVPQNHLR